MATTLQQLPQIVNLEIERGDDAPFVLTALNTTGGPMDFSGCVLWWTLKDPYDAASDDADAVAQYVWQDGGPSSGQIVISDVTTGIVALSLPSALTATLKTSVGYAYLHDIQVLDAVGDITTPIRGSIVVKSDVTRSAEP